MPCMGDEGDVGRLGCDGSWMAAGGLSYSLNVLRRLGVGGLFVALSVVVVVVVMTLLAWFWSNTDKHPMGVSFVADKKRIESAADVLLLGFLGFGGIVYCGYRRSTTNVGSSGLGSHRLDGGSMEHGAVAWEIVGKDMT
ncbi:hypothetical protein H257_03222 [Aphanomyces astaci]|uniref:Uncharacterized protein n=1 Tax=Aphanomyces astaci TaxID=112090 RepID=W4H0G8_APHAT|nr:hypothetical protein H257_03222 [Aphanomyces astaci]ETV85500.1 hypothetical protein H257_03222 [Aphanomyces astaci]|eukprot:XP_009825518.1 hypothetical protein H257_03222 [Aphanomyces astaci]